MRINTNTHIVGNDEATFDAMLDRLNSGTASLEKEIKSLAKKLAKAENTYSLSHTKRNRETLLAQQGRAVTLLGPMINALKLARGTYPAIELSLTTEEDGTFGSFHLQFVTDPNGKVGKKQLPPVRSISFRLTRDSYGGPVKIAVDIDYRNKRRLGFKKVNVEKIAGYIIEKYEGWLRDVKDKADREAVRSMGEPIVEELTALVEAELGVESASAYGGTLDDVVSSIPLTERGEYGPTLEVTSSVVTKYNEETERHEPTGEFHHTMKIASWSGLEVTLEQVKAIAEILRGEGVTS